MVAADDLVSLAYYVRDVWGVPFDRAVRCFEVMVDAKMARQLTGLARLEEEGREMGRADIVLLQLEQRFGALPDEVVERVRSASADSMARWASRLLSAATLEGVFSD